MWKEIKPEEMTGNVFQMINEDWMLITAGTLKKANAMTASWGGLGILWGEKVATAYIRPQRYTKKLVDGNERFTLSFYGEGYRKMLNYMGTATGAKEDKIAVSGLTLKDFDGAPAFEEASLVLVCKKLFAQEMSEESFCYPETVEKNYPNQDFHTMYIGEIEHVYVKAE